MFFNSHPHKEDDCFVYILLFATSVFQLTSSQGGWPLHPQEVLFHLLFNSHPHKEDDLTPRFSCNVPSLFSTHILTRRMTLKQETERKLKAFQLTSSQGGWLNSDSLSSITDFSTHILTRRMTYFRCTIPDIYHNFSTHILTRRMTKFVMYDATLTHFSTHILTRRMTIWLCDA